jgi:hypothetical protein
MGGCGIEGEECAGGTDGSGARNEKCRDEDGKKLVEKPEHWRL